MMKRKLLLALLAPSVLVAGCNAVFGIGDLDVDTGDAGDAGGAMDAQAHPDATAVTDASHDATTMADSGDAAASDAQTRTDAMTGSDAGFCAAAYADGAILCEDYDEDEAGQLPGDGHPVVLSGSVQVFSPSGAPSPPSPPNVLETYTPSSSTSSQASLEYRPDAAAPSGVTVDMQVYLPQVIPTGTNLYVVPLTVNLLGTGNVDPYNIEVSFSANSTDILVLGAQPDDGGPPDDKQFADAGMTPMAWHHVVLHLDLDQSHSNPSSVKATLEIDGVPGLSGVQIGDYGGYGAPSIVVGNTYAAPNVGAQTVYVDNLAVYTSN